MTKINKSNIFLETVKKPPKNGSF